MPPTLSQERRARVGEVELAYQTIGDRSNPPMLLIMGLASQMIGWPNAFCELLADRGFFVIRFDNRDCGRSTVLDGAGTPSPRDALDGGAEAVPYTLSNMAGDAAGVLDALEASPAHVVGVSMGGMIAQTLAIEQTERVLSLASIMSTTGDPSVGQATPEAQAVLFRRPPLDDREAFAEEIVNARAVIGSKGLERDEEWSREVARQAFDRGIHPDGTMRQIAAIVASGDRTEALHGLDVPTVVIHGRDDPLIGVSGGEATAAAIPDAELVLIDGMGHDLPPAAWERLADSIVANAARARAPTT
jgi:pimeloyl-ACP methyl ester carboxylesterase